MVLCRLYLQWHCVCVCVCRARRESAGWGGMTSGVCAWCFPGALARTRASGVCLHLHVDAIARKPRACALVHLHADAITRGLKCSSASRLARCLKCGSAYRRAIAAFAGGSFKGGPIPWVQHVLGGSGRSLSPTHGTSDHKRAFCVSFRGGAFPPCLGW